MSTLTVRGVPPLTPLQTVTATEFARNFSSFMNQVRYQGARFEIKRGNEVLAQVLPPKRMKGLSMSELKVLLEDLPVFSESEALDFMRDINSANAVYKPEVSAWD